MHRFALILAFVAPLQSGYPAAAPGVGDHLTLARDPVDNCESLADRARMNINIKTEETNP